MIIYWPNKQSLTLNLAVANLFIQTYKKFSLNLQNQTVKNLPIDILKNIIKKKLFEEILIELEILILDIIELNLNIQQIKELNNQILFNLINKVMKKFVNKLKIKEINNRINFYSEYNKLFFHEHSTIIENLLIYLIFGSNKLNNQKFSFYKSKTPIYHVKCLLENSIIQISNLIIFNFLENYESIENISSFLITQNICNIKYKSIRDISNFRNNIISNNLINIYIYYPQNIYCNKYKIWLLSSKGLVYKYVYCNRTKEYVKLSNLQISSLIYLELQDFIIPKINNCIILLGRLMIYILIEIISKSFKIFLSKIIIKLNTIKK